MEHLVTSANPDTVARDAATLFTGTAAHAIQQRGRFTVALSGGTTPRRLYELLATEEWRNKVDWNKVHFFWADERYVPPTDKANNFRMTDEALLSKIDVPEANVHRFLTESGPPEHVAIQYERMLREFFEVAKSAALPRFDLVLLGLGTNGHTASLFPRSPTLHETDRYVIADFVEEVEAWRITLSIPVLNNGRFLAFLVTGTEKAEVVNDVLLGPSDPERLPAQLILPCNGFLTWFVDQSAAAKLKT